MSMAERDGWIWFDGELVPWREARVHVLTHTLHYGLGVFEGVRAYATERGPAIFRLSDHTRRLFDSARIVRMTIPWDAETLNAVQVSVINENGLEAAYIRPMCFFGSDGIGLGVDNVRVHCCVAAWEWGSYLGAENLERGIRVKTSSYSRHFPNSAMGKAKINGQYTNSTLALQEALADGYDEALMLDTQGFVAEGSGENFFLVRDGVIYTPDLTSALNGITRNTVLVLARRHGYELQEKRITRDEVYIADEAFFTGTAAEVTPIREVDNRSIGSGTRGPVTEVLQRAFFDLVEGRDEAPAGWLTYTRQGS